MKRNILLISFLAIFITTACKGELQTKEPIFCTEDLKTCPDGTSVGRNPDNNCEFDPCPKIELKEKSADTWLEEHPYFWREEESYVPYLWKEENKKFVELKNKGDSITETLYIGPYTQNCRGPFPQKCYITNRGYFYDTIQGFEHKEKHIYKLEVKKTRIYNDNIPADASAYTYTLMNILYKEKIPKHIDDGFCGLSTYKTCTTNDDCEISGCSGQICQSKSEETFATTCEWRECYADEDYGISCGCVNNKCQWN